MSKDLFVILVNDGLFDGGEVFDRGELDTVIRKWSRSEELIDDEGGVWSVDDLIEIGGNGSRVNIINKSMLEIGDDYVSISICKLSMNKKFYVLIQEVGRGTNNPISDLTCMESRSEESLVKEILQSHPHDYSNIDDYYKDWSSREDGVVCYSDDCGLTIYVGKDAKKVVDLYLKFK